MNNEEKEFLDESRYQNEQRLTFNDYLALTRISRKISDTELIKMIHFLNIKYPRKNKGYVFPSYHIVNRYLRR